MFSICVLIVAAAAVYMVEAYIHTYYAIEYMHGTPLFFVLLAKYAAPVLFLLLCGYFVFRYREKRRELEAPVQEKPVNREEVYAEKINATVKTKAVFSDQADQMLYQVKRFGQKMAVTYSMTQNRYSMTGWMTLSARHLCSMRQNTKLSSKALSRSEIPIPPKRSRRYTPVLSRR